MPKLTEKFISHFAVAEGAKDRLVFDTECKGLGLRATAKGNKIFIVQWTDKATGRKFREPLGAWGSITLEKAREAAQARLGRVAQGINPAVERARIRADDQREREAAARAKEDARFTLEKLIEDWARLHLSGKRPRYAAEAERALRVAFRSQLGKPASALTHATVTRVLDQMASAGHAPIAGRTLAYGRACYGWAMKRRRLADNPFAGLPVIQGAHPARERVLTDTEVGAIWRAAGTLAHPFGPLVRLMLLTAQRRQEVASVRWSELADDLANWTIPAARSKNGKAHIVHLSEPARELLSGIERVKEWDYVFTVTGRTPPSGFSKAKRALDAAAEREAAEADPPAGWSADWRFHDFRRTAVTWLAGAGFPPHVADRLLNHVQGTIKGVAAVYQRSEFLAERKAALTAWAEHVLQCAAGKPKGDKVRDLATERAKRASQ